MVGFRFPSPSVPRCFQRTFRTFGVATAALAFLALLPQAWGAGPTFTVGNNTFTSTAVGTSKSQNVTLTVNSAHGPRAPVFESPMVPGKSGRKYLHSLKFAPC